MPLSFNEMALWLLFAAMTAGVVAYFVRTMRRESGRTARDAGVAVYTDQLAEIDRDVARGVLSEADADAARIEVSRRLLAAADSGDEETISRPALRSRPALWAVVLVLPLLALGFYLPFGSPGLPGQPYFERLQQPLDQLPVEGLVARLEQRLKEVPDDARGWRLIAPVYLQLGRYEEAINAFGRIMQIEGRDADALAGLGEALTLSGDGMVPPPARRAFEAALEVDPTHPRARFYLGLSQAQAGRFAEALAIWQALLADAPENAPWRPAVEQQVRAVRQRLEETGQVPDENDASGG